MARRLDTTPPTRVTSFRLPIELIAFLDDTARADSRDRTKQLIHVLRTAAAARGYDLEAKAAELQETAD